MQQLEEVYFSLTFVLNVFENAFLFLSVES
jgi:hypothetical protein